jgi:hypothetical protein
MTQADRVLSTPPIDASAIDDPQSSTVTLHPRFDTLKDAEDTLMEQGFKLVPNTCRSMLMASTPACIQSRKPLAESPPVHAGGFCLLD